MRQRTFRWFSKEDSFSFTRNQEAIAAEAALDGIYVLRTSLPNDTLAEGGSAARSGDSFGHAAWLAGVVMIASNSIGVNRPRPAWRRRRW